MTDLEPWQDVEQAAHPDLLKRFVYQNMEEAQANALPHVLKPLPKKRTVMGVDSPEQFGDHVCYHMLTRGPLYCLTCHFTDIAPHAPIRGRHRHIGAPQLFALAGKGWEWNDGETYTFETHDLLVVPPYSIHQHGGDRDIGCQIYVPAGRVDHTLGLTYREQHALSEKPAFPEGTEPLHDAEGKLIGYRIKKGVLGVTKDIEVILGPEPKREAAFNARRTIGEWSGPVENTYDRYVKLMHDESQLCRTVDHVIRDADCPWEWTRQGKLKWLVHPDMTSPAKGRWLYVQEIPAGSRSGKHRHAAEEMILVLEGRGYDVHDGERWDWEQGDFICIPSMTAHQHLALGESRAVLLSAMPSMYVRFRLGGIEQLEDAPDDAQEG